MCWGKKEKEFKSSGADKETQINDFTKFLKVLNTLLK